MQYYSSIKRIEVFHSFLLLLFCLLAFYFLFEQSCFTMLYQFLLYSQVDQLSVQSLSCVQSLVSPWTAARQPSLWITNCRSLLKLMSIESVMPSNHLILSRTLLLLPSIFPSIRVFSNESVLHIRGDKVLEFQLQHQSFQ